MRFVDTLSHPDGWILEPFICYFLLSYTERCGLIIQWTTVFTRTIAVLIPIWNVANFQLNGLQYLHEL